MIRRHRFPLQDPVEVSRRPGALDSRVAECVRGPLTLTLIGQCSRELEAVGPDELLRAFEEGGVEALKPFDGTFLLEIRDAEEDEVTVVMNPFGHRQGYFIADESQLVWGTDLKGMLPYLPSRRLSRSGLHEALNARWCLGDNALIDGIRQLQPATAFTFGAQGVHEHRGLYWPSYEEEDDRPLDEFADDLIEVLRIHLRGALRRADHPLVLLSGGVDSGLLAAVALEVRSDVVAITPVWDHHPNREVERARDAARHLGITHHEVRVSEEDLARAAADFIPLTGVIPRDFWAIVLLAMLRNLRGRGDLIIHGQGADEMMGGGNFTRRMRTIRQIRTVHALIPAPLRPFIARLLPVDRNYLTDLRRMLLDDPDRALTRRGYVKLAYWIRHRHQDLFGDADADPTLVERFADLGEGPQAVHRNHGMLVPHRANLIELDGVVRESGFELVYPFLDRAVIAFCGTIPRSHWHHPEWGKKPIARIAYSRYLPREWSMLPKLGFATPTVAWMRSCWKDWMEDRLGPESFGRLALGATMDELELGRDHQLLWTLACVEEFIRAFDVEPPRF